MICSEKEHSIFCEGFRTPLSEQYRCTILLKFLGHGMLFVRTIHRSALESVLGQKDPTVGYASLLRRYGNARSLLDVQRIHQHMVCNRYERNTFLGNLLIQMYAKCGKLESARSAFDTILRRNEFSYSNMISAYTQDGQPNKAFAVYKQMNSDGVKPDGFVFASVLAACSSAKALAEGKEVHAKIISSGIKQHMVLQNALLNMYTKCDCLHDAKNIFDRMSEKNVVTWTIIITAYAQQGCHVTVLNLFEQMESEKVVPDRFLFASVLGACSTFQEVKNIHSRISIDHFDVVLDTALINAYANCGSLEYAQTVFDGMSHKNVASWTALSAAYAQHGHTTKAIHLFQMMIKTGVVPDSQTIASILGACAQKGALDDGKSIHKMVVERGIKLDVVAETSLIHMYSKCGSLQEAKAVFDRMQQKNVVTWSSMVAAYEQHELAREAIDLFQEMITENIQPNAISYMSVLAACSRLGAIEEGKEIHRKIEAELENNVQVQSALVNMYAKCCSLENARTVFNKMHERDVSSWTSMIAAYAKNELPKEAIELYSKMDCPPDAVIFSVVLDACSMLSDIETGKQIHEQINASGVSLDQVLANALLNMYVKCQSIDEARKIFDEMQEKNVASWTSMITAYAQQGHPQKALDLYHEMDVDPSGFIFSTVLGVCASLNLVRDGKEIHARICNGLFESYVTVGVALVNMYTKFCCLDEARKAFESIADKNVVAWTAMLGACVHNGDSNEALLLYEQMKTYCIKFDGIAFAMVLNACANLGDLRKGREVHKHIIESRVDSDITMETALVDMYGKCGSLDEAIQVFQNMKQRNIITWTALIAACAQQAHGEKAIELCREMELEGVSPDGVTLISVLISCSHVGDVDEGWQYFVSMKYDREVLPMIEHYVCMVDLLGRSGWLDKAEELISEMPFEANSVAWTALLAGCRIYSDLQRGKRAAKKIAELNSEDSAAYVLLANMYAAAGLQIDADESKI